MTEGVHPKDLSRQELDKVLREMRTVHAAGVLRCEEEEAENDADYITKLEAVRDTASAYRKLTNPCGYKAIIAGVALDLRLTALGAAKEPTKCTKETTHG